MATIWFDGIENLIRVQRDLGTLAAGAKPLARQAIQKTCADIKADAVTLAPVDTGALRNSITYETRDLASAVVGEVGPSVEYGSYVEYGTTRMEPQPYMTPAFDRRAPGLELALAAIAAAFPSS